MLPNEIWSLILRHLSPSCLTQVSLASHTLHTLAAPCLYRRIDWDWTKPPRRRLLCLLRTLQQDDHLASFIHDVRLVAVIVRMIPREDPWGFPLVADDWDQLRLEFQSVIERAKQIVLQAGFELPRVWTTALDNGDAFALASIFLSQLHSLQSLRLDYSFVWWNGFPGRMLHHALFGAHDDILSRFSLLKTVDYGSNVPTTNTDEPDEETGDCPCHPGQFLAWFFLPALKSLEMWLLCPDGVSSPSGDYRIAWHDSNLSQLRRLGLIRTIVPGHQICAILAGTRTLETLHLGFALEIGDTDSQTSPDTMLSHLPTTLQHLSIAAEDCPYTWDERLISTERPMFLHPLPGLATRFPLLQTVELPSLMLVAWNEDVGPVCGLPPSLQRLCVREEMRQILIYPPATQPLHCILRDMVQKWTNATPLLREVVVRVPHDEMIQHYESKCKDISVVCADIDITLHLTCADYLPGLWTSTAQNPGAVDWWSGGSSTGILLSEIIC